MDATATESPSARTERAEAPDLSSLALAAAPALLVALALALAWNLGGWLRDAAMLPFAPDEAAMDELLTGRIGRDGAIWGAWTLAATAYASVAAIGWRLWNRLAWHACLAASVALGYALLVHAAGTVNGTHVLAQLSYVKANPDRSPSRALSCRKSVVSGAAIVPGRYDLVECRPYVDEDTFNEGCRQVVLRRLTLSGPSLACVLPIRHLTGHVWPAEGRPYEEWDSGFGPGIRNAPLATPEVMRVIADRMSRGIKD